MQCFLLHFSVVLYLAATPARDAYSDPRVEDIPLLLAGLEIRGMDGAARRIAAEDALVKLGSLAVPHLGIRMKRHLAELRTSSRMSEGLHFRSSIFGESEGELHRLFRILARIGSQASAANTTLIEATGIESTAYIATAALAHIDPAAFEHALRHDDPAVRRAAISFLGRTEGSPKRYIPDFIKALADPNESVRSAAASCVATSGADPAQAVPALIVCLESSVAGRHGPFHLIQAVTALAEFGADAAPALTPISKLAEHENPFVRIAAVYARARIERGRAAALAALLDEAERQKDPLCHMAIQDCLRRLEPHDAACLTKVLAMAGSRSEQARATAIYVLAGIEPLPKAAVPALIESLPSSVAGLAGSIIATKLGPDAVEAVPALVASLSMNVSGIYEALGAIGAPAIPALLEVLEGRNDWLAGRAALALGEMGPRGKDAIPRLIRELRRRPTDPVSDNSERKGWISMALGQIGERAVPALVELLADPDEEVRERAAYALEVIGPKAASALPSLREVARTRGQAEYPAMLAIVAIDPQHAFELFESAVGSPGRREAWPIIDSYCKYLQHGILPRIEKDAERFVFATAKEKREMEMRRVTALARLRSAVPSLIRLLEGKKGEGGITVTFTLKEIAPLSSSAVPQLEAALGSQCSNVRWHAATALGRMGPVAKPTVPRLHTLLDDESSFVRESAETAIKMLAGD